MDSNRFRIRIFPYVLRLCEVRQKAMIMIWIFILIVNILLGIKLWWDKRAMNNGRIINKTKSVLFDGSIYLASAIYLFYFLENHSIQFIIGMIVLAASWRWIAFDAIFARINGHKDWVWYGTSSRTDIMMSFLKEGIGAFHILVKLVPVVIGLLLVLL